MSFRISVDTGGTFTDVVIADAAGRLHIGKALTTPERAFAGLSAAIDDAARAIGVSRQQVLAEATLFTYGTTRATNAIVERKVAKTALLVTEGFPEILVLKEGGRFDPHKWDFDYPKPYIPRRYTFEVPERITSEGEVDRAVDEAAVLELEPGEFVIGVDNGGGGYGDPLERDTARVLADVLDGWVSRAAASDIYGVVLTGEIEDESLAIDIAATIARRRELAAARHA